MPSADQESHESESPDPLRGYQKEELAAFIELLYVRNGTVPTAQDLRTQIPGCTVTDQQFKSYVNDKAIRDYLVKERHVPLDAIARLTPKQMDWIRMITDPTDMRPIAKKLAELKITKAETQAWLNNPFYQQVLYEQSNKTFGDSRFAVLRSLQLEAMGGNVPAVKMYLEITGDYTNKSEVNVTMEARGMINTVLDVLQELVPADVLLQVVERLEGATIPSLPGASPLRSLPVPPRMGEIRALPKPKRTEQVIDVEEIAADGW